MVLQATPKVCELNCRDRPRYAAIVFRVKFVFPGINQNPITIYVTLIVEWFVWLAAVVERNWIGPNILFALPDLLPVVLPVHAMPVKVIIDSMFETGPDGRTRICRRCVNNNRAGRRTPAVINPVFASALTFVIRARDVVTKWSCIPDIDRSVELFHVVLGDE